MFNYLCSNPQYSVLEADDPEVEGWRNMVIDRMKSVAALRVLRTRLSDRGRKCAEEHRELQERREKVVLRVCLKGDIAGGEDAHICSMSAYVPESEEVVAIHEPLNPQANDSFGETSTCIHSSCEVQRRQTQRSGCTSV